MKNWDEYFSNVTHLVGYLNCMINRDDKKLIKFSEKAWRNRCKYNLIFDQIEKLLC